MEKININFTPDIINSYKRLAYRIWFALAEYVDNSTQAYLNNKEILDIVYEEEQRNLSVYINYFKGKNIEEDFFEIIDNSMGMSLEELQKAFQIGLPPDYNLGRSRYGLGMKTASFWLGDEWTITTSKLGNTKEYSVILDIESISKGDLALDIQSRDVEKNEHYTTIKINNLRRRFKGMTIGKIKSYLSSIYRFDVSSDILDLFWNDDKLGWSGYSNDDFVKNSEGQPYRRDFEFEIDGKNVTGWAGVLSNGSRSKGGFALVQGNRVIQSPPNGYKPETIFGEQEGGINNLVNQRLVGELFLEGFEVSHTKDNILWEGTQMDDLDDAILEQIGDFRKIANEYRKNAVDERAPSDEDFDFAVDKLLSELNSGELSDIVISKIIPPEALIFESNKQIGKVIIESTEPTIIKIAELIIKLYIDDKMSANDPYVINDSISDKGTIIVIVNKNHPFWNELDGATGILNYLRQCVYDAVSEWKAYFMKSTLQPDTIKHIKDDLMRVPFIIDKNKV
ncbi:ATP-binding protein [Galbibacter sp. EGI 63066]|uniref:ATP-binding protein n=1 Tax=Galbibacter sp. EGI 63066 TaxID=2993559 RepID=UPI002248ACCD|nr:ATP-binding protein [Galbibacter sp. EGI 63066]MCX2678319.1 ATP-binding protein [Galbibacter sp. EGI 63066]